MKTLEIAGYTFEVINKKAPVARTEGYADLYSYYNRPSDYKLSIYDSWLEWCWLAEVKEGVAEIDNFHVASANTMQFTLEFNLLYEGVYYLAYITRDHNRLYPIHN